MNKFRLLATLLVVALCTTTIFTSCRNNDDDDNGNGAFEIRATNVINSSGRIATVRAELFSWDEVNDRERTLTTSEAPFQNNGFTLRLIDDVPSIFLYSVAELDGAPEFTISDRNARIASEMDLLALNSGGDEIGLFWLGSERENEGVWAFWIYADRNVTIRGTFREECCCGRYSEDYWNVSLSNGWNTVYWQWAYNESTSTYRNITTQRPSGANLQWQFEDWSRSSRSATTRATENRRSVFRR